MQVEILTREDLERFRLQLLSDIKGMLGPAGPQKEKEWLKNSEVRQLLKISSNTVQRLRIKGQLKSTKIGGIHYYAYEDIAKLLQTGGQ